jgi:glycosyltransferase involved in cell wall biosynthesis
MSDKPKLLWHSNAPWSPTGYGQQTAAFLPYLKDRYDVANSAFFGLEGNILPWHGIPVLPGISQTHGNEAIREHATKFFGGLRDGLVFTLMDVWVLNPQVWRELNVMCWTPVDHEPCPPPVAEFFPASGAIPVAMSRFGERMLKQAGLDPLYVPHGIDTEVYKPVDKAEAREASGMPKDAFVVGMVAANKGNPSRKCFHEAFQAFKLLHDQHDDARLYVHAELTGLFDGVNLPYLLDAVGIPRSAVMFADQYRMVHYPFNPETLAAMYSSLDVLLAPSAGEGFGIPVVEAQACGTPVIVSDFSAQPELVGAGWTVSGRKVYTPIKSWQFLPDVDDIVDALRKAYNQDEELCAKRAREFAVQYDVRQVLKDHMLPTLEAGFARFEEQKPVKVKQLERAAA